MAYGLSRWTKSPQTNPPARPLLVPSESPEHPRLTKFTRLEVFVVYCGGGDSGTPSISRKRARLFRGCVMI